MSFFGFFFYQKGQWGLFAEPYSASYSEIKIKVDAASTKYFLIWLKTKPFNVFFLFFWFLAENRSVQIIKEAIFEYDTITSDKKKKKIKGSNS